jgi:hypothetical protein
VDCSQLILDGHFPSGSRVTGILYTSAIWVGGLQILLGPVGNCRRICIEGVGGIEHKVSRDDQTRYGV